MLENFFDSVDYATRHYEMQEEPEEKEYRVTINFDLTIDATGVDEDDAGNTAYEKIAKLFQDMVRKYTLYNYEYIDTVEVEAQ